MIFKISVQDGSALPNSFNAFASVVVFQRFWLRVCHFHRLFQWFPLNQKQTSLEEPVRTVKIEKAGFNGCYTYFSNASTSDSWSFWFFQCSGLRVWQVVRLERA